jgi:hypothetical protein
MDEDLHDACKRAAEAIRGADIRMRWSSQRPYLLPFFLS